MCSLTKVGRRPPNKTLDPASAAAALTAKVKDVGQTVEAKAHDERQKGCDFAPGAVSIHALARCGPDHAPRDGGCLSHADQVALVADNRPAA